MKGFHQNFSKACFQGHQSRAFTNPGTLKESENYFQNFMLKVKRKMQLEYVDHENLKQKYLKKNKNFRDVRESIHGKLLTEIGPILKFS